jgi:hypothetical protein
MLPRCNMQGQLLLHVRRGGVGHVTFRAAVPVPSNTTGTQIPKVGSCNTWTKQQGAYKRQSNTPARLLPPQPLFLSSVQAGCVKRAKEMKHGTPKTQHRLCYNHSSSEL